jgi:hypothetical protein
MGADCASENVIPSEARDLGLLLASAWVMMEARTEIPRFARDDKRDSANI